MKGGGPGSSRITAAILLGGAEGGGAAGRTPTSRLALTRMAVPDVGRLASLVKLGEITECHPSFWHHCMASTMRSPEMRVS
eukprot:4486672-Pyramimonas_sp.AAC.1